MNTTESTIATPPIKYATFTTRMLASTVDLGMIFMVVLPIVDLLMGQLFTPINQDALAAVLGGSNVRYDNPQFIANFLKMIREQHIVQRMFAENLLQLIFVALYTLPFWFRFSATPGKMLLRLQIQDKKTGLPMSDSQAVLRFFGYIVSILPLSLGFLWIGLNKKCQGFHDLIAGTVVVVKPRPHEKASENPSSAHQSEGP